jgi:hypothetical protein
VTRIACKDLSNLSMILASAEWIRASDRGDGFAGWPEAPDKVLAAKLERLADRGVFMDGRGWLDTTTGWRLPDAEKATILAALDEAGHRFDGAGYLVHRPEDVAEGDRKRRAVAVERQRLRMCKPTNVSDLIGKMSVLTMDAAAQDMEDFILYGRRLSDIKAAGAADEPAPVWGLSPTLRLVVSDG